MRTLRTISLVLVIIGAVNWGLIALFQFDLVASLFGGQEAALSRLVYGLVGIAGLICISFFFDSDMETTTDRDPTPNRNQASFGTEFADDFDPEYRAERERAQRNDDSAK